MERNDAEQQRSGKIHLDAQRVGRCEGQHGDRDGRAGHIDGGAQRNGNGVGIRIEAQTFAEIQIDRDIGRRASGEEGVDAGFTDGGPYERIGFLRIFRNTMSGFIRRATKK